MLFFFLKSLVQNFMTQVCKVMILTRTYHVFPRTPHASPQRKTTNRSAHFCMLAFANGESGVRILTAGQLGDRRLQSPSSRSCSGTTEGPRWPIPWYCLSALPTCPHHSCSKGSECRTFCARMCDKANERRARDVNPPKQKKRRNEARTV